MNDILFFKFEVLPRSDSRHAGRYGPTVALCWVRGVASDDAERHARRRVADDGWRVESLEERGIPHPDGDTAGARYLMLDPDTPIYAIYIATVPTPSARRR